MGDTQDGTWSSRELGAYIRRELVRQEELDNLHEMAHADPLQQTLAAYCVFFYPHEDVNVRFTLQTQHIRANDVTTPETEGGYDQTENSSPGAKRKN